MIEFLEQNDQVGLDFRGNEWKNKQIKIFNTLEQSFGFIYIVGPSNISRT